MLNGGIVAGRPDRANQNAATMLTPARIAREAAARDRTAGCVAFRP